MEDKSKRKEEKQNLNLDFNETPKEKEVSMMDRFIEMQMSIQELDDDEKKFYKEEGVDSLQEYWKKLRK
jgi:hypothetical protein